MDILTDRLGTDRLVVFLLPAVLGLLSFRALYSHLIAARNAFDAPYEGSDHVGKGHAGIAQNLHATLEKNYRKYRTKFFKIKQPHGDIVVLPAKYIEELKSLPEEYLSMDEAIHEKFVADYTLLSPTAVGGRNGTVAKSVTNNLTRSLNGLMKDIHEETELAFKGNIGQLDDWTEVNIFHKLVPIVALVSGRVFIGEEFSRNPEYLRCIIQFTMEVFTASATLQQWPHWLHPIVYRFIPQVKSCWDSLSTMSRIMAQVVPSRVAAIKEGKPQQDMVTWNLMNSHPTDARSIKVQSHAQLSASMAAIHTTSMTASHIAYDLAAGQEYIQPLREEIQKVMDSEPVPWLTKASTPKLKLLDSICKESQRMNPLADLNFDRKVKKAITLHDGTVLPAGTSLNIPISGFLQDPELYDHPEKFDGYRFLKLRQQPGNEHLNQFVSTSIDNMSFGIGKHACPGRFFANNEIKVIVMYLLMHYDIKMPEGQGRPGNIITPGGRQPDTTKSMLMRSRKV